jgi:hypothetical protein
MAQEANGSYLTEAEVTARLQSLEKKHDLLKFTLDGWCVWPLLRFSVSRAIQNVPHDAGGLRVFSKQELLRIALKDLWRVLRAGRARYVVKTYSFSHSEIDGGKKKDSLFDETLRAVEGGYKIEVVSHRPSFLDPTPRLVPSDLTTVGMSLVADRLSRRAPSAEIQSLAVRISEAVCSELGPQTITSTRIVDALANFRHQKRMYRWILRRLRAKFVLFGDSGDYAITAAAKELGMKAIEFQHGITHRHYPANSWSAEALPYKARMLLPDRILLYGAHWRDELAAFGFWREELCEVGSTRVDTYRARASNRDDSRCTIVFTTQGTDTLRLAAFLKEFADKAAGQLAYKLVIKMHPAYPTAREHFDAAFAGNNSVDLVAGTTPPTTFELLKRADLHASIYSFCHYEALALGVPTIIVGLTGAENVEHLQRDGHAFMARTPTEMLQVALRWRELRVPAGVGERYFSPGALPRIVQELST